MEFQDNVLKIRCVRTRITPEDTETVSVNGIEFGRKYRTNMPVRNKSQKNKIFYMDPVQIEVKNAASLPILAEGAKDVPVLAV